MFIPPPPSALISSYCTAASRLLAGNLRAYDLAAHKWSWEYTKNSLCRRLYKKHLLHSGGPISKLLGVTTTTPLPFSLIQWPHLATSSKRMLVSPNYAKNSARNAPISVVKFISWCKLIAGWSGNPVDPASHCTVIFRRSFVSSAS